MVKEVQSKFKLATEDANYSIFDIECLLKQLAAEGVIWMIKPMKNLTEAETILVDYYLNEKREIQIYDFVQSTANSQNSSQSNPNNRNPFLY